MYSVIRYSPDAANFVTELWREERALKQDLDPETNHLPVGFNPKADGQGRYIENLGRLSVCLHILLHKMRNHKRKSSVNM